MVGISFRAWWETTEDEREGIMISILDDSEEYDVLSQKKYKFTRAYPSLLCLNFKKNVG
jgi:hypothetical protein